MQAYEGVLIDGSLAGIIGRSIPDLSSSFTRFVNGPKDRVENRR